MSENIAPEDLPEFLNTEPDTTGEGLICTETGDRLSWEDLDRAYLGTSVREFLEKTRRDLSSGQTCRIRINDRDDYEHLSFTLRKDTDFDTFKNVFDQDLLDAGMNEWYDWHDEEGHTIFITADIEL